jgi:hypothetical protein
VIVKILSHLGLPTRAPPRSPARRVYSKRSEQSKTACQRKPTAPLALSSSERRDKEPFTPFSTAFRPLRRYNRGFFIKQKKELTSLPVVDMTRS